MTDKPKPPTLSDTKRPPKAPQIERALRDWEAAHQDERPATHTKVPAPRPAEDDDAD